MDFRKAHETRKLTEATLKIVYKRGEHMKYVHMFAPFEQTIEKLKGLLQSQREKINVLEDELRIIRNQKEEFEYKYNTIRKMLFGSKSERHSDLDDKQGNLFNEIETKSNQKHKCPRRRRKKEPATAGKELAGVETTG